VIEIAVCFLTDERGWVLLQERDSGAPRYPDCWGMVGGHVDPGEDFDTAVHREILEETGLVVEGLTLWSAEALGDYDYRVYAARTTYCDADVVVGEGRQIVFVEPGAIGSLTLSDSSGHFLPRFLESELYCSWHGATDR
jgi:8-oxo-dGTP pyrophosphatase MutT (NUDIX family)